MPGGDRTGPYGGGPRTGRGLGYCADNDQPGYTAAFGRGFRRGGRGWRNRFNTGFWPGRGGGRFFVQSTVQDQDLDSLRAQTQELANALQEIQNRLTTLEPENTERK
jgi:hypothetical protein